MSHEFPDHLSPVSESRGWRCGDTVFLGSVLAYAALNVVLMLMYANSMLGRVPFGLIFLLIGISGLGVIAAFPIQRALRHVGVTWRGAVAVTVCFALLSGFNLWCFAAASAAV